MSFNRFNKNAAKRFPKGNSRRGGVQVRPQA
jgi:hypothetical protein